MAVGKACHWSGPKVGEPDVPFVSRTRTSAEAGTTSTQSTWSALELLVRQLLARHPRPLGPRTARPPGTADRDSRHGLVDKATSALPTAGRPKCRWPVLVVDKGASLFGHGNRIAVTSLSLPTRGRASTAGRAEK
jgi:hypothetical protein